MLDLNSRTWQPAVAFLPNEMQDRYPRLCSLSRYVRSIMPIPSKWKFSNRQIASYHRDSNAAGNEYGSTSQCIRLLRTTETAMLPAMNMEGESLLLPPV
ncbi:hypothetical protein Pyn_35298 [Prunus yedoensis var. nudiflora]|uniref:Uncharacterized protein n=1 Tax=Prunus yedoensis var. nudiflora TaxID=2094558 RepID=A0A314YIA4_PRUYE|nr:hypothetical protein Pyn_35298 [Prunus yedoensis var. nudiflora]